MTSKETEPDLPVSVHDSLEEAWVDSGVRGTKYNTMLQHADIKPSEGGCYHCYHYSCHSLASGQTTGMELSPTHQQKIGLKIY